MPRTVKVYRGLEFFPTPTFYLMDRPAGPDEVALGSGDISATYDLKVYDITESGRPTEVHSETTGNLTRKAAVTIGGTGGDPLWTLDDVGWTMSLKVDPVLWAVPAVSGKSYRIVLFYTSIAWGNVPLIWQGKCVAPGAPGVTA
jgi:hypothetical protein